ERGEVDAETSLGWRYYQGDGVARNQDLARQWLQRAAEQGDRMAAADLGLVYRAQEHAHVPFAGDPADTDPEKAYSALAESWLRRSADGGNALGAKWLGDLLMAHYGSTRDAEAVGWYRKAVGHGIATAELALADACAEGRGTARDYGEALRWYRA